MNKNLNNKILVIWYDGLEFEEVWRSLEKFNIHIYPHTNMYCTHILIENKEKFKIHF